MSCECVDARSPQAHAHDQGALAGGIDGKRIYYQHILYASAWGGSAGRKSGAPSGKQLLPTTGRAHWGSVKAL